VLGPYWEQPGRLTKSKEPHRVPLAAPGVAMLRWLPPRVTKKAGPAALVFAGRGNKTVGGWTLIRRALLASADVTPARGTTSGGPSCPPLETRGSTRKWPISCLAAIDGGKLANRPGQLRLGARRDSLPSSPRPSRRKTSSKRGWKT
jgi:hypothetical protein